MVLETEPVRSFWLKCKSPEYHSGLVDNFSGGSDSSRRPSRTTAGQAVQNNFQFKATFS